MVLIHSKAVRRHAWAAEGFVPSSLGALPSDALVSGDEASDPSRRSTVLQRGLSRVIGSLRFRRPVLHVSSKRGTAVVRGSIERPAAVPHCSEPL